MPALPDVPQVLKIQLHWTVEGDPLAMTVMHYHYTGGPPSPANCATMGGNFVSNAASAFSSIVHTAVGITKAMVTDLSSPTASQGEGGSPWGGSQGGSALPPGAAAVANYLIARRYRGGKPRNYFPLGGATDLDTTGLWLAASVTAWEAALVSFLTSNLSAGAGCTLDRHVNVSYYHGSTVVTNPITGRARNVPTLRPSPLVDTINGSSIAPFVGSQRRRNRDA